MLKKIRCLVGGLMLAASLGSAFAQSPRLPVAGRPAQACAAVTARTCALAHALRRGINMGSMLDAPAEGEWGHRLESGYADLVAGKFDTVRLPVRWSNNAAPTADATLDERFAKRVDQLVDDFLGRGMHVILNVHHYNQIVGAPLAPGEFAVDPAVVDIRLVNIWRQLALRYLDRSPKLVFELMNEPYGRLDGAPWNRLAPRVLAAVRESNPDRAVMIGATYWSNAAHLPLLRVPRDRNLIVTFHHFHPFEFTHQGEKSREVPFPVGTKCCDARQRKVARAEFQLAERWSRAKGYPLHLGEFGSHNAADVESRAAYARMMRDESERRGIGWAYWEFVSNFGLYLHKTGEWVEPIKRALLD